MVTVPGFLSIIDLLTFVWWSETDISLFAAIFGILLIDLVEYEELGECRAWAFDVVSNLWDFSGFNCGTSDSVAFDCVTFDSVPSDSVTSNEEGTVKSRGCNESNFSLWRPIVSELLSTDIWHLSGEYDRSLEVCLLDEVEVLEWLSSSLLQPSSSLDSSLLQPSSSLDSSLLQPSSSLEWLSSSLLQPSSSLEEPNIMESSQPFIFKSPLLWQLFSEDELSLLILVLLNFFESLLLFFFFFFSLLDFGSSHTVGLESFPWYLSSPFPLFSDFTFESDSLVPITFLPSASSRSFLLPFSQ